MFDKLYEISENQIKVLIAGIPKENLEVYQENQYLTVKAPELLRKFWLDSNTAIKSVQANNGVLTIDLEDSKENRKLFEVT